MNSTVRQQYSADPVSYRGGVAWNTTPQNQQTQHTYQTPQSYYGQPPAGYHQHTPTPFPYTQQPHVAPQHHQHHHPPPHVPTPTPEPVGLIEPSESYETSVYVGLEDAPVEFRLAFRVIGEKGQNLEYLSRTTGAKVILRGRGTGIMNNKPLHIYIGHATLEGKEEAESLANNLVRAVKEEFADWRKGQGYPQEKRAANNNGSNNQQRMSPPTGRSRDMRDLRITRDPAGGRVEMRRDDGRLGRVEVRQEDSRRVVKIPRPEQSALSRLGPRVERRPFPDDFNREHQASFHQDRIHPDHMARGRPSGRRSRSRSRSPLRRDHGRKRSPPPPPPPPPRRPLEEPPNRRVHVRPGAGRDTDLRSPLSGDKAMAAIDRARGSEGMDGQKPKETLTITTQQDNRDIRTGIVKAPHPERQSDHRDDRRDDRYNRITKQPDDRRNDRSDNRRNERRHSPGSAVNRGDPDQQLQRREAREPSPQRGGRRPEQLMRDQQENQRDPPADARQGFGMAAMAVKARRNYEKNKPPEKPVVWGRAGHEYEPGKSSPKFFVPGMHGEAMQRVLDQQDFTKLLPIFVVRKGFQTPRNYIWIIGDTAAYLAAQRAAEHCDGPNLGMPKTMILWFGFPGLKMTDVLETIKGKMEKNLPPDAIILHVGGEDLINYFSSDREMERHMTETVEAVRKMLPQTHLSWSNILPWRRYPTDESQYKLENLRLKMNNIAKGLMKQHKGSTLYHDNDFVARKDGVEVYHRGGFYPSHEGAKFMVMNFGSIIQDLVSEPSKP